MGESACWLHLVCPSCGHVLEDPAGDDACPRCGVEDRSSPPAEDTDAAGGTEAPPGNDQG